jgi:hypothetical protein
MQTQASERFGSRHGERKPVGSSSRSRFSHTTVQSTPTMMSMNAHERLAVLLGGHAARSVTLGEQQ